MGLTAVEWEEVANATLAAEQLGRWLFDCIYCLLFVVFLGTEM